MNNLILNKSNFIKITEKLYSIINDNWKDIVIKYEIFDNNQKSQVALLRKIQKNPIKLMKNPLSFQQNIRNEWK